ncbi:MAG: 2-hexaprenyl-6-methoxy-1,4-benzoquinone methyltransferase [Alectoria sarmentosa]|nr:MAG: 2-hexaprenyl-6-methoxy-1,4-benzoquinone methyltransferase [Alectoria sarmentosa]
MSTPNTPRISTRLAHHLLNSRPPYSCLSCTRLLAQQQQQIPKQDAPNSTTHFGFKTVPSSSKQSHVANVFTSVASSYDTMNDLMSVGTHRLWKDYFVRSINPGIRNSGKEKGQGQTILDVAGGTGDIAFRVLEHCTAINNDHASKIIVSDINPDMLAEGKRRARSGGYEQSGRLSWMEANAEDLSEVGNNSIDLYTVAFGIRNFTHKDLALREAFRVLKPGGVFACLEFSKVNNRIFEAVYKRWSFGAIPLIGQLVAGDRESYQYLVESIERFPGQEEWKGMIEEAGFLVPGGEEGKGWDDLMGGIACVHKGMKPLR